MFSDLQVPFCFLMFTCSVVFILIIEMICWRFLLFFPCFSYDILWFPRLSYIFHTPEAACGRIAKLLESSKFQKYQISPIHNTLVLSYRQTFLAESMVADPSTKWGKEDTYVLTKMDGRLFHADRVPHWNIWHPHMPPNWVNRAHWPTKENWQTTKMHAFS